MRIINNPPGVLLVLLTITLLATVYVQYRPRGHSSAPSDVQRRLLSFDPRTVDIKDQLPTEERDPSNETPQKCAIVAYISSSDFAKCARVLSYTVRNTTSYPMVMALTTDMNGSTRDRLAEDFDNVVEFDSVKNPNAIIPKKNFINNYAVLQMWTLVQYDRVVAIDADMLVTQSLDELCETELPYESVAASNNWWTSTKTWDDEVFNGGLMVLRPSTETYSKLMAESRKFESPSGGVQPFLNHFFRGSQWIRLNPQKWGMNANAYSLRPEKWDDSIIHSIHYTMNPKPCHTPVQRFRSQPANHPFRKWHEQYYAMRLENRRAWREKRAGEKNKRGSRRKKWERINKGKR